MPARKRRGYGWSISKTQRRQRRMQVAESRAGNATEARLNTAISDERSGVEGERPEEFGVEGERLEEFGVEGEGIEGEGFERDGIAGEGAEVPDGDRDVNSLSRDGFRDWMNRVMMAHPVVENRQINPLEFEEFDPGEVIENLLEQRSARDRTPPPTYEESNEQARLRANRSHEGPPPVYRQEDVDDAGAGGNDADE